MYAIITLLWKGLILKPSLYYSEVKKYFYPPGENAPDQVKVYPVRKSLHVRYVSPFFFFFFLSPQFPIRTITFDLNGETDADL